MCRIGQIKISVRVNAVTRNHGSCSIQVIFVPFLRWGNFHARSRFARSTIPEEKWGPLVVYVNSSVATPPKSDPLGTFNRTTLACMMAGS